MIDDWSPETLAKLSLMVMFIPAGLTVLAVVISTFIGLFMNISSIDRSSFLAIKLNDFGSKIFYIAYLSVILINVMVLGLVISGIWGLLSLLSDLIRSFS